MDVIGHRGAAALAPENTIASIEAAWEAGADGVEIDVRLSSDGALVLMHDVDVSRTTAGTGRVDALPVATLRELGVPTLEEVLERLPGDRSIVIEVKGHPWEAGHDPDEPAARAVGALLAPRAHERRVVVSSFNPRALRAVREAAPTVRTAILTPAAIDLASNLAAAVDGGYDECHVPASILDAAFVLAAHDAGRRVVAWTVDDGERLTMFREWGVDGAICDDPAAARRALAR
jgi:glycerophosphoryl diester phosphodiesterase